MSEQKIKDFLRTPNDTRHMHFKNVPYKKHFIFVHSKNMLKLVCLNHLKSILLWNKNFDRILAANYALFKDFQAFSLRFKFEDLNSAAFFFLTKKTFNEAHSTGLNVTFLRCFFTVLSSSLREAFDLFIDIIQLVITMYAHSIQINIVCPVKLENWMIWTFEFKNYL